MESATIAIQDTEAMRVCVNISLNGCCHYIEVLKSDYLDIRRSAPSNRS